MMHTIMNRLTRVLLGLGLLLGSLALTISPAAAAPITYNLCALPGTLSLPGGANVPVWGFGIPSTPGNCATATASLPGPVLTVNEGDAVTITITNALPAGHTLTFEAPGVGFDPGPISVGVGSSLTRTFTAVAGTYIYQSGGDSGRQAAMGLYGALIVRPLTAGRAYSAASTAYDVEAVLVLSQVDPNFNAAPDTADMYQYAATYWLINGKAYPNTDPIHATAGQRVLLRYLNAGRDNTTMQLLGMHEFVAARDARLLTNPISANAETIPAGETEDAIATVPAGSAPGANGFALYNRQLHVTNGAPGANYNPGGMLTFIRP